MNKEIERKFLINLSTEQLHKRLRGTLSGTLIKQGYIAVEGDRQVRIRSEKHPHTSACFLTFKVGVGMVRLETEIEITEDRFHALAPLTLGRRVEKLRHYLPYDDQLAIVDIYRGEHEGLIVVEVEFDSEEEAAAFTPPDWWGPEVTNDEAYSNVNLSTRSEEHQLSWKAIPDGTIRY